MKLPTQKKHFSCFLFPVIQHYKAILMLFVDFADDLTITHPYNELIISVFY